MSLISDYKTNGNFEAGNMVPNVPMNDEILVFFDTNIFRNAGFDFNADFYLRLERHKEKFPNLRILVVPILYHELVKQVKESVEVVLKDINNLLRNKGRLGSYSNKIDLSGFNQNDFVDCRVGELKAFLLKFTDESSFDLSNPKFAYNTTEVLHDFFGGVSPFSGSKKYEFKDAFLIQNIKHISMDSKYENHDIVVVSDDAGFREGVQLKIERVSQIFKGHNEFFNFLSAKEEMYNPYYSFISDNDFTKPILNKLNKYKGYYISVYDLEEDDIFIDDDDFDRKNFKNRRNYDYICLNNFCLSDQIAGINILEIDEVNANVSIEYRCDILLTVNIDNDNYDYEENMVVNEKHEAPIYLNVKLKRVGDEISISESKIKRIKLNRDTLRERSQPINVYHESENRNPRLTPHSNRFLVQCESCDKISEFDSPGSGDFEVSVISEGGMGEWVQHTYNFNGFCDWCSEEFEGEIRITEYPYLTVDNIEVECNGGDILGVDYFFN